MDDITNLCFSSFLAGFLLTKKSIANLEFSKVVAHFETSNNIEFSEYDFDYDKIHDLFYLDKNGFHLKYDYDDIIVYNKIRYKVDDYLYSFTNEIVRNYFNIPEKNNFLQHIQSSYKKRRG